MRNSAVLRFLWVICVSLLISTLYNPCPTTDDRRVCPQDDRRALKLWLKFSPLSIVYAETIPFAGMVTQDKINLRAGGNLNFEAIGQLNRYDKVIVIDESYGWYKIELPESSRCYISKNYVDKNRTSGIVSTERVNIRAGAGTHYNFLGQLNRGDLVTITGENGDWYQILPPKNCFGWVKSDFIQYYSTVNEFYGERKKLAEREKIEPSTEAEIPFAKEPEEGSAGAPFVGSSKLPETLGDPIATGRVEDVGKVFRRIGTHKLLKDGKITCYLTSDRFNFSEYTGYEIAIWGKKSPSEKGRYPLITVEAIKVVE